VSSVRDEVLTATRAETTSPAHAGLILTLGFEAAFGAACAAAGARRAQASTAATRKWCEADTVSPLLEPIRTPHAPQEDPRRGGTFPPSLQLIGSE
jgi:hypothetical protein